MHLVHCIQNKHIHTNVILQLLMLGTRFDIQLEFHYIARFNLIVYKRKYTVPNLRSDWTEKTRRGLSVRGEGLIIWHHCPKHASAGGGSKSHSEHTHVSGYWSHPHACRLHPRTLWHCFSLASHNWKQTEPSPAGCQISVVCCLVLVVCC